MGVVGRFISGRPSFWLESEAARAVRPSSLSTQSKCETNVAICRQMQGGLSTCHVECFKLLASRSRQTGDVGTESDDPQVVIGQVSTQRSNLR